MILYLTRSTAPEPKDARGTREPPAEGITASQPAYVLVSDRASMDCGGSAGTIENPTRPRISAAHIAATTGVEGAAATD